MTLHVLTARVGSREPDVLDITRKTAEEHERRGLVSPGAFLAPSRPLLDAALADRRRAKKMRAEAAAETPLFGDPGRADALRRAADALEADAWELYVPRFRLEMLASHREHRRSWDALLALPRVVLVCFCSTRERCHRGLVAGYLARLGAVDGGEV